MSYEILKSETTYRGKIIDVVKDTISIPNGKSTIREVVIHGDAAAIIPVDKQGNIIFVRQYRHPAKKEVLEIPAGMLEEGEDPLICAKRELEEETSFKAGNINLLFKMYSSIGFSTEILYIYEAYNLENGEFNFDEDEFISVEKYSVDEAVKMIFNGEIEDGKTISAVLAYKAKHCDKFEN